MFYYATNIFDLHIFDKEAALLLNFSEIYIFCRKNHEITIIF